MSHYSSGLPGTQYRHLMDLDPAVIFLLCFSFVQEFQACVQLLSVFTRIYVLTLQSEKVQILCLHNIDKFEENWPIILKNVYLGFSVFLNNSLRLCIFGGNSLESMFLLVQYISRHMIYIIHISGDISFDYLVNIRFSKFLYFFHQWLVSIIWGAW